MKSYLEYLQQGNNIQYIQRWLPWQPTDKNGNPKEEILNNVSAGYIPGLIWYFQNKNKQNEKASVKISKNTSYSNGEYGNSYVVDIPASVNDTTFKIAGRTFTIHINNELRS